MTETEEAATDAQWSQAEADRIFYARGFPLADYEDEHDTDRPRRRTSEREARDGLRVVESPAEGTEA